MTDRQGRNPGISRLAIKEGIGRFADSDWSENLETRGRKPIFCYSKLEPPFVASLLLRIDLLGLSMEPTVRPELG